MRYVKSAFTSLILLAASATIAQDAAAPPAVGDQAPPLDIEVLLQAPDDAEASWAALRGKVVVLEFWATWCGPCIAAVPHLNDLVEHFRDEDVVFISVTDEKEEVVAPFLEKKTMKTWVGLDLDRSLLEAFKVRGIPQRRSWIRVGASPIALLQPRNLSPERAPSKACSQCDGPLLRSGESSV